MSAQLHQVLKAAGEPTRLRILNLLRRGGICVCDLQQVLQVPQYAVSRHLAALRHAGLVTDERVEQRVVYSLVPPRSAQLRGLRELLDSCGKQEKQLAKDLARLKTLVRKGKCSLQGVK